MNDPVSPSNNAPRPSSGRTHQSGDAAHLGQEKRKLGMRGGPSRESQFIGYLVLALGIVAVISVLLMALSGGVDTNSPEPDPKITQALQNEMASSPQNNVSSPMPAATPELALKRQNGVKANDLNGGWKASIGDYVAVMQIDKGLFQIILAPATPGLPRIYTSGTFKMLDDIAILEPRSDWKAPKAAPNTNIQYERLTRGTFPMVVGFQKGAMIWQNVPVSEKRIYVPPRSPLLLDQGQDYIVWKSLD